MAQQSNAEMQLVERIGRNSGRRVSGLDAVEGGYTAALRRIVRDEIEAQPLAEIDYVSVADGETLAELDAVVAATALCSVAVRFGGTRLIDNVVLTP